MADLITSFSQLLAPFPAERFFAQVHHREPLYVSGAADKFASVLSWEAFNQLLAMDVWTQQTLQLCLERRELPASAYCRRTVDRNRQRIMQPDAARVTELMQRGATLLVNEVETLHPGISAVVQTIAETLNARSAANLYCSWGGRQGFDSHYDRHDVYALQIAGKKRWHVYEGRIETPIEHAAFYNVPQTELDRLKGRIAQEVELTPGDLLYLPRGQFHDALASSEASLHVTISCSEPTGLDWLTTVWERMVHDSRFRAYLQHQEGPGNEQALQAQLADLVEALRKRALSEQGMAETRAWLRGYPIKRNSYDLPALEADPESAAPVAPKAKPADSDSVVAAAHAKARRSSG